MYVFYQLLIQNPLNSQSLRDIKPPFEVNHNLLPYIIIGTIICVVLVSAIWYYYRKVRQNENTLQYEEERTIPPHEIALEKLNNLEKNTVDMIIFHIRISYIIREYITARYHIPALELTSFSLIQQLYQNDLGDIHIDRIKKFLANCDRVKFTKYQPEQIEAKERMADAKWLIQNTMK